jgi:hypothetical protein
MKHIPTNSPNKIPYKIKNGHIAVIYDAPNTLAEKQITVTISVATGCVYSAKNIPNLIVSP